MKSYLPENKGSRSRKRGSWASRAATAGLRAGDVILKIADKPTDSLAALQQITAALPATGRVRITIWRQQKEANIEVEALVH
jgi:S1-C subfamily serine protease